MQETVKIGKRLVGGDQSARNEMDSRVITLVEQLFDECTDHFADIVGVTERVLRAVVYEARRRGLGLDGS